MNNKTSISSVAEQLAEYRRRKRMERTSEVVTETTETSEPQPQGPIGRLWTIITASLTNLLLPDHITKKQPQPSSSSDTSTPSSEPPNTTSQTPTSQPLTPSPLMVFGVRTRLGWLVLTLKVVLWLSLWQLFIYAEFGAVYFLVTGFVFIWVNLRSGPKEPGEVSAYSVFNKDFKQIHGTYTSEQFERELLFRT